MKEKHIAIDEETHRYIKLIAARKRLTMKEWINKKVEEEVK